MGRSLPHLIRLTVVNTEGQLVNSMVANDIRLYMGRGILDAYKILQPNIRIASLGLLPLWYSLGHDKVSLTEASRFIQDALLAEAYTSQLQYLYQLTLFCTSSLSIAALTLACYTTSTLIIALMTLLCGLTLVYFILSMECEIWETLALSTLTLLLELIIANAILATIPILAVKYMAATAVGGLVYAGCRFFTLEKPRLREPKQVSFVTDEASTTSQEITQHAAYYL